MEQFKKYFVPGGLGGFFGILAGFLIYYFTGRHYALFVIFGFFLGAFIGALITKSVVINIKIKSWGAKKQLSPVHDLKIVRKLRLIERLIMSALVIVSFLYTWAVVKIGMGNYAVTFSPVTKMLLAGSSVLVPLYTCLFFIHCHNRGEISREAVPVTLQTQRASLLKKVGTTRYILRLFFGYFQNYVGIPLSISIFLFLYGGFIVPIAVTLFCIFILAWIVIFIISIYVVVTEKTPLITATIISLPTTIIMYYHYRGLFNDVGVTFALAGITFIIAGIANYVLGYGIIYAFNKFDNWFTDKFSQTKTFAYINDDDILLWGLVTKPIKKMCSIIDPFFKNVNSKIIYQ